MIFDTHAHYDSFQFDDDREEVLKNLPKEGIRYVLNVAADLNSVKSTIKLVQDYPYIYGTIGVHPHSADELTEEGYKFLEESTKNEKILGIGEIGLDYYRDLSPRDIQRYWFNRQLELAYELDLPVVIHTREAIGETFEILKASPVRKGVIHAYSGSFEMAEQFVDLGFHLGIGGVLTYKNVKYLKEVVEKIDMKHLLLETDAPYLPPHPHRGERNTSQYLPLVVEEIGRIKQISTEKIISDTTNNAKCLFSVK